MKQINLSLIIVLIIALLSFVSVLSCNEQIKHNIKFQQEGFLRILPSEMHDTLLVKIEFAESDSEMMQGLMYRHEMADDEGMLFIYPEAKEMYFWMKNTYIPLDLLFIDEAGEIVDLQENATPLSEKSIMSNVLSRYVLEVNAGFCEKNFVIIGDKVIWSKLEK